MCGGRKKEPQQMSSSSTPRLHMPSVALASTAATVLAKFILHPLDTLKCRLQSSNSRNLRFIWGEYAGKWGPRYLYGGLPIKLAFYVPYQAIYMPTYNSVRDALMPVDVRKDTRFAFITRTVAAASAAELASCIARVPMETVKMRIQATAVPNTKAALRLIFQQGFFASVRQVKAQTLVHDIPYSITQWIAYESFRPWTQSLQQRHELQKELERGSRLSRYVYNFLCTFLAGGFSGLIASTVTVPLDTIRTRVVVATASNASTTVLDVVRDTYRLGGAFFFFRGGCTRVLWVTLNMAVYFPLYETFKMELLRRQEASVSNLT
ncbi:mitochondrial carrier protein [Trypanosoma cruzi Dm28c]|uniref:Mitochondrial carrier protein n=1 Tax=Trypanosoma cruzi Dm28c TaxID=1416333 RepID=V5DFJ2_TRYCR|nr:mitochondrial carrier protein [Trypanosoma cruzi Dm28c]